MQAASCSLLVLMSFAFAATAATQGLPPGHVDDFAGRPRVVVLSDIGNEPDDQMSFVRLLLYSNELDLEGLVATTSTWQKDKVQPDIMRRVIDAYGEVRPNLLLHAKGWPEASALGALVVPGQPGYGMAAVGPGKATPGSAAIIRAADRPDPRPLWISVWGGANTLAQALLDVRASRPPAEVDAFVAKLRVRSISDQDDAGAWIRREFPGLFYVGEPSAADSGDYLYATWTGISGDVYYRNCDGADGSLVTNAWLDEHVRAVGPLGRIYPRFAFIMEGDTPSFLGLTDNGLNSYRNPSWGGWGGRYAWRQPRAEPRPFWTQGGDLFARVTSQDAVAGNDGRTYVSDQATIWRWRRAFQHDFAARMQWTVKPYADANHAPAVALDGRDGTTPVVIDAEVGTPIALDASASRDPDGDALRFEWFHYPEAGFVPGVNLASVEIANARSPRATITPTAACRPSWMPSKRLCPSGIAHVVVAVTDDGSPALTRYRRVILRVRAPASPPR
jgi:hypothetical protein